MLKHLLIAAVAFSSVALADGRHQPPHLPLPPMPAVAPPPPAYAPPPPPRPGQPSRGVDRDARFDVRRGRELLRDFERAASRRDVFALRAVDAAFQAFVDEELAELRFERGRDHGAARELVTLQRQLAQLQHRADRFTLNQRRALYGQAVAIAERDLQPMRHGRSSREGSGGFGR